MTESGPGHVKNSVGRLIFVVLVIIQQIGWIVFLLLKLNNYSAVLNAIISTAAFILVLRIYGKHINAAFKMPWIILILMAPLFGMCMYLMFGHKDATRRMRRKFHRVELKLIKEPKEDNEILRELEKEDFAAANQFRYIKNYASYPVYKNTDVKFYAEAADGFEAQLKELKKAKEFIFMEYHAIEEAIAVRRLKEVLAERVSKGVEVRMLYDDIGSIGFIDPGFIRRMREVGIKCRVFNPVMPVLNIFMNNRDHRKITVIDGKVGFTGGYNLADEYFGITKPLGHWKDTGIRLEGDAVRSLTAMFLEMWNAMGKPESDCEKYFLRPEYRARENSFVQPYADSPLDDEYVGENVYLNMIKSAKHRFYAATPYLIISDEMTRELCLAAQRGVDVRIITPGIPDKKYIYSMTRSYYAALARRGVRIYEYTPGFLHAKEALSDNGPAVVGTINFDYRSLYHHFENAVLIYGCGAVNDIEKDFENMFKESREVTEKYKAGRTASLRIRQCFWRLFAPLL